MRGRRRCVVALPLLLLSLLVLSACSANLPSEKEIQEAPQERLASLLPPLQARVKNHPDDDDALRRLALAEVRLNQADDAVAHARQAVQAAPFTAENFLVLGEAYEAADKPTRAAAAYVQAAALEPSLTPAYLRYAQVQAGLHAYGKALRALNEALRRDPKSFDAQMLRARMAWDQGDLATAIAAIEAARVMQPENAAALLLHVQILDAQGHVSRALTVAREGLQQHPLDRGLQVARVRLLRERREWAAALDGLAQLAQEAPLTPEEALLRVEVLEGAGRDAEAGAALTALLRAHPDFAPGYVRLARRLALQGKARQALTEAQQASALAPRSGEARYWEAVAHFELDEGSLGDAALSAAASADPNRLAVKLLRIERLLAGYQAAAAGSQLSGLLASQADLSAGLLLQSAQVALSGNLDQAQQVLERLPPDFAPQQVRFASLRIAYLQSHWADVLTLSAPLLQHPLLGWRAAYLRGSALLHLGRWADGLATVKPYLEGDGRRIVFFRLAGYLHLLQGDRDAARRDFEAGLSFAPGNAQMIEGLSRIALETHDWARAEALLKQGLQAPGPYRTLFLARLVQAAEGRHDAAGSTTALQHFLAATDPAEAGAPSQPASDVLYGGYYPPYGLRASD